ncbi:putative inactive receptor kinase [Apostasia shenzhenica]|uniref:Putative inactive receptor kinase n=1 Tax=Apostasia shenzhenica TaxID=1088818 RepID=A0A2I0ATW8_9ASPA|nr:putative inactive receptor kinase [Apostasia shenzhenica]
MEARACSSSLVLLFFSLFSMGVAEPVEDKRALLDFLSQIPHGRALNWSEDTSVCGSWRGVICNPDYSRVVELRLPGIGFNGAIPSNTLSRLSGLQILSLRSNGLTGPFPADFSNLTALTGLHLQLNGFSGPLPSDFSPWKNLTVLDLSFNDFNGSIPTTISNLTQLAALNLSNNSLSGRIPDLRFSKLQMLNVSNNLLNGNIPKSLQRFPDSSFAGNELSPVFPAIPSPAPSQLTPSDSPSLRTHHSNRKLSESALLGIAVGGSALVFVLLVIFLVLCYSGKKDGSAVSGKGSKGDASPEKISAGNQDENNRIVFFEGCNFAFDLEDLLRASAEVLGKGTYGTTYKAVLEDSTTVVVKRLKEVSVGKKDFEQQMDIVGKIHHENIVELKAYYYSKDEKLMLLPLHISSQSKNLRASLVLLAMHGKRKRGESRSPLDWETRLRVALGAARGIAHIHLEQHGKLVHGNIKSSNVFLNNRDYGCLSDLGLSTIIGPTSPHISRIAGYRAPEVADARKASQFSDIYSFGVLLLELLTGKSPIQISGGGDEVVHLVRWVHSVVREEWTAEVFDVQLMRYANIEEEMVEMLRIAMACVARMPEQRPKMTEVVSMIEDVRRTDNEYESQS